MHSGPNDQPTARELEVLLLVAEGLRNSEIGERLGVSEDTIDTHVARLRAKLQCRNRTELANAARKRGLLPREHRDDASVVDRERIVAEVLQGVSALLERASHRAIERDRQVSQSLAEMLSINVDMGATDEAKARELIVAYVRTSVFVLLTIVQLILTGVSREPANAILAVLAVLSLAYAVSLITEVRGRYHPSLAWKTSLVDALLLTGANVGGSVLLLNDPSAITKWASLLALYFVIIIVAAIRLSPKLVLLVGASCCVLYLLSIVIAAIVAPGTSFSYGALSTTDVNFVLALVFDLFLLLATLCLWVVLRLALHRD